MLRDMCQDHLSHLMRKLEAPCAKERDEKGRVDDRRVIIGWIGEPEELEPDHDREGE